MKRLSSEDIIDLEIFIKSDESESEAFKESRDFRIYASAEPKDKASEISLLKHWIEQMRKLRGGHCAGAAAELVFKLTSAALFLAGAIFIGAPLANAFFISANNGELINVSYFFFTCVFVPFALFLSAVFLAPSLGLCIDYLVSGILKKFFKFSGGIMALYSTNKKWILLKGAIAAQYLGLGVACGILFTQVFKPMFNEYQYGWRTTLPNYVTPSSVYKASRIISLPWAIFAGAELGYPSLKQVEDSLIKSEPGANSKEPVAESSPRYETWAVFFILSCLFYGVFVRLCVLLFLKLRIARSFGPYRIKNDRKISEILRRMRYSSLDSNSSAASSFDKIANQTAVLLRLDMRPWSKSILKSVKESLSVASADIVEYSFGRELFGSDVAGKIEDKKNIAFIYLADDYNEEVFENIENLVNRYPDKFISVHLLGKLSRADSKFLPPLPLDKSWWERKVNSISSRNIKLF